MRADYARGTGPETAPAHGDGHGHRMAAHPRARRGRRHAHLAVCLPTGGGPRRGVRRRASRRRPCSPGWSASRPRCWCSPRSSGSAWPSAARRRAGRRQPAGSRSGCAQSGRSQATPRHDPRPAPQHLLQPGRMGGDHRAGPLGRHEELPFRDCLRARRRRGREARYPAGADKGGAENALRQGSVPRPLRPGDVRAAAGKRTLHVRGALLSGICRGAAAEATRE